MTVRPIMSCNPLIDLIEIFPGLDKLGLQIAHIFELIARFENAGIVCHFRTSNLLEQLYLLMDKHQVNSSAQQIDIQEEPCFNIFASFVSVLQYFVTNENLDEKSPNRKYFDYFIHLSKLEELHWIIQKPWTGGTVILQKLFTTHWHYFSHMLPLINYEDLEFGEKLGAGTFGTVFRGLWKRDHETVVVAIKVVDTNSQFFDELELRRELLLLYFLKHPNLVDFYGGCYHQHDHSFIIVTRLYDGSLRSLFDSKSRKLTQMEKYNLALQIGKGIKHLHDIGRFSFLCLF